MGSSNSTFKPGSPSLGSYNSSELVPMCWIPGPGDHPATFAPAPPNPDRFCTSLTISTTATGAREQAMMTAQSDGLGGTVWSTRWSSGTETAADLEEDAGEHGRPEPAVREQPARERGPPLRPRVEGVGDLGQGQRHEGHRRPPGAGPPLPTRASRSPTPEGEQRRRREQQALPGDQPDEPRVEQLLRAGRGAGASSCRGPRAPAPGPWRGRRR